MAQKKYYWVCSLVLIAILALIFPLSNQYSFRNNNQSLINENTNIDQPSYTISSSQSSSYNTTFLPKTNLTVQEFIDETPINQYNITILSINKDVWSVHSNYYFPGEPQVFSFDSTVNRTSVEGLYEAYNYYNWFNQSQDIFDYWINDSDFEIGNEFEGLNITSIESITMKNLGTFTVWKLSGEFNGIPVTIRYEVNTGMFICTMLDYGASIFWYNITKAEIGQIKPGYTGPTLLSLEPKNNSIHPNGTIVSVRFTSPYDIYVLYYKWDSNLNYSKESNSIDTPLPDDDGFHHLYITVIDSIAYSNSYNFVFETNNDFPGISLINVRNNSRIQGSSQIFISIINGNGSFIYNWDEVSNTTVDEGTSVIIFDSEGEYILNIYAKNKESGLWTTRSYLFIVDNTPPILLIHDPSNRSVIKGTVNVRISVSEESNITYELSNGLNDNFIADIGQNYTITFLNLLNGSYHLVINAYDEATNPVTSILLFDVYTSAFNWNWNLEGDIPQTIDVVDAYDTTWFFLTILSKTDQTIKITLLSEGSTPEKTEKMQYGIEFNCEYPDDILFLTFSFPLNNSGLAENESFDVYQWIYWDNQTNQWIEIPTSYNAISYSWDATIEGAINFFGLSKTGDTTELKSIEPGGGQIPSFEFTITMVALIGIVILNNKTKRKIS